MVKVNSSSPKLTTSKIFRDLSSAVVQRSWPSALTDIPMTLPGGRRGRERGEREGREGGGLGRKELLTVVANHLLTHPLDSLGYTAASAAAHHLSPHSLLPVLPLFIPPHPGVL